MRADAVYFEGIRTTITAARTPTIIGRPRMRRLLLARTIRRSTRLSSSFALCVRSTRYAMRGGGMGVDFLFLLRNYIELSNKLVV